jgi:hypothetical protein
MDAKQKGIEILANTANAFDQSRSAVEDLSKLNNGMADWTELLLRVLSSFSMPSMVLSFQFPI